MEQRYITVAKLADIDPGKCLSLELKDIGLALFNVDGEIYALDNTCPHAGGPLGEGTLEHEVITCPWHGWKFNVRTGQRLKNPSQGWTVFRYKVRVVDGAIQVLVPAT
jgi:nitrite reductase (NADH) small subunit/3-phenylpropionate/trans-cinnamate dioxygenase ferredoxin subunit